ncbi:MAG TPA: hypothetical protein PLZ17_01405 [Pseudomonadota bacterium]|nr:hypothetical protein [Pseudomonadota bacterium]
MRFALRCTCALLLLGSAAQAAAQANVQVTGTAHNIPFPTQCRATAGVQYTFSETGTRAQFACNGIAYDCEAKPLKADPANLTSYQTGNPGTLQLNCGDTTSITGLQTFVADMFPTLQSYIDAPDSDQAERFCMHVAKEHVTAVDYDPSTHLFTYTCTADLVGGGSDTVACYTIQPFRYDATNTTLLMPDCIDGTDPTQSPYLLEDGYEDA